MARGSRHRGSDLFTVAALAANALARPLSTLGHPLGQERGAALGTRLGNGARPSDELALGVLVAGIQGLAALAPPVDALAPAAGLRTHDREGDGLGRLALWVTRARDELPEAAVLDDHGLGAGRADLVGQLVGRLLPAAEVLGVLAVGIARAREELAEASPLLDDGLAAVRASLAGLLADLVVRHARLRLADILVELLVELTDQLDPIGVALLDLIERLFALGREVEVHDL